MEIDDYLHATVMVVIGDDNYGVKLDCLGLFKDGNGYYLARDFVSLEGDVTVTFAKSHVKEIKTLEGETVIYLKF